MTSDSPPSDDADRLRASLLEIALDAAAGAGTLLLEGLAQRRSDVTTKSSGTDMVSDMDRASEALIVDTIAAARPEDSILGEEGGQASGSSPVRWVVDPLDGTTNYLYGHPGFAVSIAAEVNGEVEVAVVADPSRRETFSATSSSPSRCNGEPISCSTQSRLDRALVGTGFSYMTARRSIEASILTHVLPAVRDIRRYGAAAIDLCWVACGRLDAYYELQLQPWDVAAGLLIARQAGALTLSLDSDTASAESVVASAPEIGEGLRALVRHALPHLSDITDADGDQ